jgi:hypothetical protein
VRKGHHALGRKEIAQDGGDVELVLTEENVEGRHVQDAARQACRQGGRDLGQNGGAHGRADQVRAGHLARHGLAVAPVHRPDPTDGDGLVAAGADEPQQVAAALVQRRDNLGHDVDEHHFRARVGKQLPRESPPHVPRAKLHDAHGSSFLLAARGTQRGQRPGQERLSAFISRGAAAQQAACCVPRAACAPKVLSRLPMDADLPAKVYPIQSLAADSRADADIR